MFGLNVLRDVIAQCRLIAEALVAGEAAERSVGHVAAHVALEVGQLRERLGAASVLARVRLRSSVSPYVLLQVTQLSESSLTHLTTTVTNSQLHTAMGMTVIPQILHERNRTLCDSEGDGSGCCRSPMEMETNIA